MKHINIDIYNRICTEIDIDLEQATQEHELWMQWYPEDIVYPPLIWSEVETKLDITTFTLRYPKLTIAHCRTLKRFLHGTIDSEKYARTWIRINSDTKNRHQRNRRSCVFRYSRAISYGKRHRN